MAFSNAFGKQINLDGSVGEEGEKARLAEKAEKDAKKGLLAAAANNDAEAAIQGEKARLAAKAAEVTAIASVCGSGGAKKPPWPCVCGGDHYQNHCKHTQHWETKFPKGMTQDERDVVRKGLEADTMETSRAEL
jgi:hypothetical protein